VSIINHEYKHIFIHVPRTAGTSMESMSWVGGQFHESARTLIRKGTWDYFSWAFTRHPADRLLSVWSGLKKHESLNAKFGHLTFNEFVAQVYEWRKTGQSPIPSHTETQCYYVCNDENWVIVDFLGKYEYLEEDWEKVCQKIIGRSWPLPRLNQTEHGRWRECLSKQSADMINEMYAVDFVKLGYDPVVNL